MSLVSHHVSLTIVETYKCDHIDILFNPCPKPTSIKSTSMSFLFDNVKK